MDEAFNISMDEALCNNEFMNVCAEPSGARRNEFQRQTKSKSLQVEGKMVLF